MKMKWINLIGATLIGGSVSCGGVTQEEQDVEAIIEKKWPNAIATESGIKYVILKEGEGNKPKSGTKVSVHYVGSLLNGVEFDSSVKRGEPLSYPVNKGVVIKGWDEVVMDMKKGEKRVVIIPPELGYGSRGAGTIPANSTLVFEMELVDFVGEGRN